jgi:hypothetical protein
VTRPVQRRELAETAVATSLYDSEAMRRFDGIELGDDRIPDETKILNFRHLLERHGLTEAIFAEVNGHLADKGITLRSGTLVDATIIDAPSSTTNKAKARDPEMSSTKKGNAWYFGMKAHVGVDVDSGIVHSLEATTANAMPRSAMRAAASITRIPPSRAQAPSSISCVPVPSPPRASAVSPPAGSPLARWTGRAARTPGGVPRRGAMT